MSRISNVALLSLAATLAACGQEDSVQSEIASTRQSITAAPWVATGTYQPGDQVSYGGSVYRALQAHSAQTGWEPPNVGALWQLVGVDDHGTPTPSTTPSASGLTLDYLTLEANCDENPADCCAPGSVSMSLSDGNDVANISQPNRCVLAKQGNDTVFLQSSGPSSLILGSGDDTAMDGAGDDLIWGGLGRDTINGYGGTNLFFGGPGDDTIMAANGTNTVIPGAGRDTIALGTGNDTVYIFDLCEVSAGETIDGGAGVDTLIAPVPLSELRALGVTVVNIEKFVVRPNSCRSECVTQPTCVHGQCAETKPTGAMACFCNEGYLGAKCERPLPARSEAERGGDYVGATDVGSLIVTVADGDASAPLVEDAVFRIKALDEGCIPSLETVCRYSMSVLRIRVSGFSVAGQTFTGATIRNDALIPITVGGNFGFTRPIPSSTRFTAWIEQPDKRFVSFLEAGTLNFTFHPAGSGSMALNGAFEGKVLDKDLTAEGSIIVSPLANVPPIANAGDDNNFAANDCVSTVTLNGTRSSDPNDNLESYLWRSRGFIVGRGATPAVRIPRSGLWKFELEARDSFRSTTRDTVVINATLPEHCGHL